MPRAFRAEDIWWGVIFLMTTAWLIDRDGATEARGSWSELISRRLAGVMALVIWLAGVALPVAAVEIEVARKPVLRKVLALYDGNAEATPAETRLHRLAEMPINHLGFELVFRDINRPLPDQGELREYRAVVTWLIEPMAAPKPFAEWLLSALETPGLGYVVLGEPLPSESEQTSELATKLFARLGLVHGNDHYDAGIGATVEVSDPELIGFERSLDKALPEFPILEPMRDQVSVHLALSYPDGQRQRTSAVVVTGRRGGYAAEPFTIYFEPTVDRMAWVLNPFAFFRSALGREVFPIPDTTTVAGRRIYFSHIDGDGWNNQSEIAEFKAQGLLSSEVIWRQAIERYPDLPVSVALISCDIDPEFGADASSKRVARGLFALPQVEVASHTHTHPFNWRFFEAYDRTAEMALVDGYSRPQQSWREALSEKVHLVAGKPAPVTRSSKYIAGSDDLPRSFLKNPFDLGSEITGSLKIAESLAPVGKRAKIYQWSGDTTPFEAAIRSTRQAGVRNINGGDSRFDREFPSVAYVPAISRVIGGERQIYAANSNENTYTNDWTGPYHGFFMLEETLKNTERPRRLKPFNLYYHMYSGEKPAALAAIRHFLEKARSSPVIPIAASEYARIADDYFAVKIEQVGAHAWAVESRGALETVRFDDAGALGVDLTASAGVIGFNRINGSLYVTLDSSVDRAIVQLGSRAKGEAALLEPAQRPIMRDSRWRLSSTEGDACRFKLKAQGFGRGDMTWLSAPGRRFGVEVQRDGQTMATEESVADAAGEIRLALAADAIEPVEVKFTCHD